MNNKIEEILNNFSVNDEIIPISHVYYKGSKTTYIIYTELNMDDTFYADDERQYFVSYFDFDIYTKGDYTDIVKELIKKLESNGFRWRPDMSSEDRHEYDTDYNHKTLCFTIERNDL